MNTVTHEEKSLELWFQEKIQKLIGHTGWHGCLSGVESEALLRAQDSFTYLLRQGEKSDQFYLSFVRGSELLHLPFTIDYTSQQWFYRNSTPHFGTDLNLFIPEIMHCEQKDCRPLAQFAMTK